jgi:hypothetical protein
MNADKPGIWKNLILGVAALAAVRPAPLMVVQFAEKFSLRASGAKALNV